MNEKNIKVSSIKLIIVIVIAAAVVLNVAAQLIPETLRRFDVTASDSYTLSESAREYLSSIDEKVTLYVIEADGSDIKYEYLLRRIDASCKNIDVKWTSAKGAEPQLKALGLTAEVVMPYLVIAESEKRSMVIAHAELMTYKTDNSTVASFIGKDTMTLQEYEYITQMLASQIQAGSEYASQYSSMLEALIYDIDMYFNAEAYICRIVEYVLVDIIPARYTLTGHGEKVLGELEMGYYLAESVGLRYNTLDLTSGAPIPKDAVSIVVLDPKTDISKAEADMLIEYLDKGGQMTFFTSDEDLELENLMSVMDAYGLSAEKGIVSEIIAEKTEGSDKDGNASSEGEGTAEADAETETETKVTDTLSVYINTEHNAMSDLKGMSVVPKITKGNSIIFNNAAGLTLTPLVTTSEGAYVGENTDDKGARSVAAISEKTGGGILLWFTGAESFTSPILENTKDTAETARVYNNMALFIASLKLAPYTYESVVTLPEAKYYGERLMSATETSFVVSVVIVAVAVVAAAVFGVIFWYKRKKA